MVVLRLSSYEVWMCWSFAVWFRRLSLLGLFRRLWSRYLKTVLENNSFGILRGQGLRADLPPYFLFVLRRQPVVLWTEAALRTLLRRDGFTYWRGPWQLDVHVSQVFVIARPQPPPGSEQIAQHRHSGVETHPLLPQKLVPFQ